jgi:CheY-like chemotaxis protein
MSKRALIVDDFPFDVELTRLVLESCRDQFEVVVVADGEEALHKLNEAEDFDVILLDLKLPKIDGLEVLQTIRADAALKSVPVVMLTSSREEQDLVRSYELGVNAYVVKPVEFSEFVEAIADLGVFWAVLNEPPPGSMRFRRVPLAE